MVDGRRPGLRQFAEADENRLPAFRKEGLVLHRRDLPARAKRGDLVRKRLWYLLAAGLLPEFAGERRQCIKCTLEITDAFAKRAHHSIVLRSLSRELLCDREQRQ